MWKVVNLLGLSGAVTVISEAIYELFLGGVMDKNELANYIDHTNLHPHDPEDDIKRLCEEAKKHNFRSVCVTPYRVPLADKLLEGNDVLVDTVIGFPLGANSTEVKRKETEEVISNGADEVDMVINIAALKDEKYDLVRKDIKSVVGIADEHDAVSKVIIETCYLTDEEKRKACELAEEAGADFVKTSTGFGDAGARIEDVELMNEVVGGNLGIKASGGIGSYEEAIDMIEAGATRIGASSGVEIVSGAE